MVAVVVVVGVGGGGGGLLWYYHCSVGYDTVDGIMTHTDFS